MEKEYLVVSFYHFISLENPEKEAKKLFTQMDSLSLKGRIYVSEEGVNAQFSGKKEQVKTFLEDLRKEPSYQDLFPKIQEDTEPAFCKLQVKVRELVAFDQKVDLENRGVHISAKKWKEMLESKDEDTLLIDARNDYESSVGHFEGAILPPLENFRDFPEYTDKLLRDKDPTKTKVMMYCTGGIRCEYYSAYVKSKGFDKVYQLEGGIVQYGKEEGKKHWKGKLFVFDDRLVVPISEDNQEMISHCLHCKEPCDVYYNCANMDCNELFIACPTCIQKKRGCCCEECEKGRIRPFDPSNRPKPFRKWKKEEKQKLCSSSKKSS